MKDDIILNIEDNEYPPKYVGHKTNGKIKMVYRIKDNDMGLVFKSNSLCPKNPTWYEWEQFNRIEKSK